jgi:dihydroorotase
MIKERQMVREKSEPSSIRHDLVLKGGRVIDPATNTDRILDLAVSGGHITAMEPDIPGIKAKRVIDVSGKIVTAGLIDTHAHIFQHVAGPFGLNPDAVGVESGVATLIDQGGPSCLTIDGFRKYHVEGSKTRVRCFLSTYLVGGLYGHIFSELYGPEQINVDATIKSVEANRDLIRGIKSHAEPGHYSKWKTAVLAKSKEIGRATNLPVYVHLGTLWPVRDGAVVDPQALLKEVIPLLDPADILAHPFTKFPSGFTDDAGKVHPLVFEAIARGVKIDVGRGNHFSIKVARDVLDAGVIPHTLGADLHGYNITPSRSDTGNKLLATANSRAPFQEEVTSDEWVENRPDEPKFSLYYAMSEMLALGISLNHVIAMVTSNAAAMIGASDSLGSLAAGRIADVAVMDLQPGNFVMVDGAGEKQKGTVRLRPQFALMGGEVVRPSSDYLPFLEREAA